MPDSSRVLQVWFVRYINEKTHLHQKNLSDPAEAKWHGERGVHVVGVSASVSPA